MSEELTREDVNDWYAHAGEDEDFERFLKFALIGIIGTIVLCSIVAFTNPLLGSMVLLFGPILSVIIPGNWLQKTRAKKLNEGNSMETHRYGIWKVERFRDGTRIDRKVQSLASTARNKK